MNNQKINLKHLLPKRNHNGNWNSHVSFVVTITTLKAVHITMKWPNFSREIHNPLCLLNLFHSSNPWLLKPPLLGAVLAILMMRPRWVHIFVCLMGLIWPVSLRHTTHQVTLTKENTLTMLALYRIHHHPLLVFHWLILCLDHFRLRNPRLNLSYDLLRALSAKLPSILVHVLPTTTTLLKIWLKNHVLCLH